MVSGCTADVVCIETSESTASGNTYSFLLPQAGEEVATRNGDRLWVRLVAGREDLKGLLLAGS